MKLTVLALCAAMLACRSTVPVTPTATQAAQPTATITAHSPMPERMVTRSTVTPVRQCAVTAEALTVRTCGDVQCAAIGWLTQGEVITTTQIISGWVWTGAGFINSSYCKEKK